MAFVGGHCKEIQIFNQELGIYEAGELKPHIPDS